MLYYTAVLKLAVGKMWQKKLAKEGVWNWLLVGRLVPISTTRSYSTVLRDSLGLIKDFCSLILLLRDNRKKWFVCVTVIAILTFNKSLLTGSLAHNPSCVRYDQNRLSCFKMEAI